MVTNAKEVLFKIWMLPKILEAAQLLYDCKLIKVQPHEVVKLYVKKNPDINEHLKIPGVLG